MSRLVIEGQSKLMGELELQGAKNSALPILAATVVCDDESIIHNCPILTDIDATVKILRYLGCKVKREGHTVIVDSKGLDREEIPDELMREMRSSIIFLGALLSRCKNVRLSLPGGCNLGPRPIDLHLKALRQMGVQITEHAGFIDCSAPNGINGAKIVLSFPSVGATENIILAAVKANGTTVITNAATEPEISDLCDYLISCGAKIDGFGSSIITIDGTESLHGCNHAIIPDRIVAATYMSAVAACQGDVWVKGVIPTHLNSVITVLEESGCSIVLKGADLNIRCNGRLNSLKLIRTMPYPGFPTDAQPPLMAMSCIANGTSVFVENVFENRYKHISELVRMGANINAMGKVAVIEGVKHLYGANVEAQDLRGAAALVVAGLFSEGTTSISGIDYLERGYEDIDVILNNLGANVKKI